MKTQAESFIRLFGRATTLMFGGALLTTLLALPAAAGCGAYDPQQPGSLNTGSDAAQAQLDAPSSDDVQSGGNSIVGMWKVLFKATDGSGYTDFGYSQWHGDGTEFLNSGSRAPSTQNYCLGVYQKTGGWTYKLNHFALSYDSTTGVLNGKVNIRENVTLGRNGNTYAGTFVIEVYDPTGKTVVAHFEGNITATRVTVDTINP
ncbi:MAG TPA: hypothetical protein VHZ55_35180 [Bryobacteraceae bacterium]|jgi:hypothetical protein|nr:hypothetical protein [Bryobacteraceae bacterium]